MQLIRTPIIVLATFWTGAIYAQTAGNDIPAEAKAVIKNVKSLAHSRDFIGLRHLMSGDFIWNFGPDGNGAHSAIQAWQHDPTYLKELNDVIKHGCHLYTNEIIVCPGKGGMNFRAGFQKLNGVWRMSHFVAGD